MESDEDLIGQTPEESGEKNNLDETTQVENPVQEPGARTGSKQFLEWLELCEKEPTVEKKIRMAIDFMRLCLSSQTPRFKDFWESRRICLTLFKETMPVKVRSAFWSEYIELSSEARRLKQILDEQSAFAIEQIELAIQSIEGDLEHFAALLEQTSEIEMMPSHLFKEKRVTYAAVQKELHLLSTLAARINALRKEILKTEMRIRIKNRLLERLSLCGDHIFPKRKEIMKRVSDEFLQDVKEFVQAHFQGDEVTGAPLHVLRDEIKFLQALAKQLTLNTQAFNTSREELSQCWDKIKIQDKERKQEISQKRETVKQAQAHTLKEKEEETKRREKINTLKEELSLFLAQAESQEVDTLQQRREEFATAFAELALNKVERQMIERTLKQLKDIITDKKENAILALSEDDLKSLGQLKGVLKDRMQRRTEIKNQLEHYRKALGGSGFDFEKAMYYREQIETEKLSLEKIDTSIEELEQKIDDIQG